MQTVQSKTTVKPYKQKSLIKIAVHIFNKSDQEQ